MWCAQVLSGMKAEETIRDVATCDLQLLQHQQLWAEILAHEEAYVQAVAMGQRLQEQNISNPEEVNISFVISYTKVITDVKIFLFFVFSLKKKKINLTLKKKQEILAVVMVDSMVFLCSHFRDRLPSVHLATIFTVLLLLKVSTHI